MSERDGGAPVVVIGTGPSGAAAAARLVERKVPVVLLESGTTAPRGVVVRAAGNVVLRLRNPSLLRTDRLAPASGTDVVWYSTLAPGGLSNYWTAAVPRFAPSDFDEGARLDERYRWPVRYEDVEPYYVLAERYLNVTADDGIPGVPENVVRHRIQLPPDWRDVLDRGHAHGDGLGAIPLAKGAPWMFAPRGIEFSSYDSMIRPLHGSVGFEVRTGAHATKLVWSSTTGRVEAVEYVDRRSGEVRRLAASAVMVAAGAIDTTMLLLRSVSDDHPDGLGNAHGLLGAYLHDHPREWWPAELGRSMRSLAHPLYLARQDPAECDPLMATSHTIGLARRTDRLRTYVRGRSRTIGVQVFGTMVPRPEVGVTIDRADDPVAQRPTITLSYDDAAIATIRSSRQRLAEVLGRAGLPTRVAGPFHDLLPGSSVHMAGTARMHARPEFGVTDGTSRIHGVPNVYVCDMSVFTTGPEKNPTLTSMALAIRAADHAANERCGTSEVVAP